MPRVQVFVTILRIVKSQSPHLWKDRVKGAMSPHVLVLVLNAMGEIMFKGASEDFILLV